MQIGINQACLHVCCLPEAQAHGRCGWSQWRALDPEALPPLARTWSSDDVETYQRSRLVSREIVPLMTTCSHLPELFPKV